MKAIKKLRRLVALFLTLVFMMPTIYSCSDQDNRPNNDDYLYKAEVDAVINGIDFVKKSEKQKNNHEGLLSTYSNSITQEIVDEYAVLLGYNNGDLSASSLNSVLSKYAEGKTYSELMDEFNLSEFSKVALESIKTGNTFENLNDFEEFISLDADEKQIVSMSNSLMKSYYQTTAKNGDPHTIEEATGALVGLLIGGALCGVFCAIGGAILGAIIGGGSK